jgi:hypothetical protein
MKYYPLTGGGFPGTEKRRLNYKVYKEEDLDYFEEQEEYHCAVHAINNLWGSQYATFEELTRICHEIINDEYETLGAIEEHCDESGMFSVQVVERFYQERSIPVISFVSTVENCVPKMLEILNTVRHRVDDSFYGFIVSNGEHWIAIRMFYSSYNMWAVWIDSIVPVDEETEEELEPGFSAYNIYNDNNMNSLEDHLRNYFDVETDTVGFVAVFKNESGSFLESIVF